MARPNRVLIGPNAVELVQPEASSPPVRRTLASELASDKLY